MAITKGTSTTSTPASQTQQEPEEKQSEYALRPKSLANFIGQSQLKKNLSIILGACKKRNEPAPHLLFYGPPGLGKTTLSNLIAREMGGRLHVTSGAIIEKSGDLASLLSSLEEGDVLFLDEIHRLRQPVEEILYSAMEDFALDIIVGKGPGARSMRLQLPHFTLVAATTKLGSLSAPLRDRFGESFQLRHYEAKELIHIVQANAIKLEIEVPKKSAQNIAKCSRGTPRIANRILRRLRDVAHIEEGNTLFPELVERGLRDFGIDEYGLGEADRSFLSVVKNQFGGGPVGVSTLAAATAEEKETIEDIREPFLLQLGFLQRTPQGRVLTEVGETYLNQHLQEEEEEKQ